MSTRLRFIKVEVPYSAKKRDRRVGVIKTGFLQAAMVGVVCVCHSCRAIFYNKIVTLKVSLLK